MRVKRNSRLGKNGSSVILVIVAMAFLGLLGALVLNIVLTNIQLKSTDTLSKRNFYTEEIKTNEITAQLEVFSAEAMEEAYAFLVQNYATFGADENARNKAYAERYMKILSNKLKGDTDYSTLATQYKVSILQDSIKTNASGTTTKVSYKDTDPAVHQYGVIEHSTVENAGVVEYTYQYLTIKDVRISYIDAQGYENIITTDINMSLPVSSGLDPTFSKYALISDEQIKVSSKATVHGGVYAGTLPDAEVSENTTEGGDSVNKNRGGIWVNGNSGDLTIDGQNNNIITRESLIASNKSMLKIKNAKVWAKNIVTIGSGEETNIGGIKKVVPYIDIDATTRVQDDLAIKADYNKVVLKKEYYGFSYKSKDASGNYTSNMSSAINVNGRHTSLDLGGLNKFVLWGRSFISSQQTVNANSSKKTTLGLSDARDIMMGQSIAAKYDQMAYIIPTTAGLKISTNPISFDALCNYAVNLYGSSPTFDAAHPLTALKDTDIVDFNSSAVKDIYDKYLDKSDPIRMFCYTVGTGDAAPKMINYYFNFKDDKAANDYYEVYFNKNKSDVISSFDMFYDIGDDLKLKLNATGRYQVAGNVVYYDKDATGSKEDHYKLEKASPYTASSEIEADTLRNKYHSLQLTLNEVGGSSTTDLESNQLVDSIVDLVELRKISTAGEVISIPTCSDPTVTNLAIYLENKDNVEISDKRCGILIASGDVTIKDGGEFTGVIIADGKIIIEGNNSKFTANETLVMEALNYDLKTDKKLKKYLTAYSGTSVIAGDGTMDFAKAISYENWRKNS